MIGGTHQNKSPPEAEIILWPKQEQKNLKVTRAYISGKSTAIQRHTSPNTSHDGGTQKQKSPPKAEILLQPNQEQKNLKFRHTPGHISVENQQI
jgi:hypothetical protein